MLSLDLLVLLDHLTKQISQLEAFKEQVEESTAEMERYLNEKLLNDESEETILYCSLERQK